MSAGNDNLFVTLRDVTNADIFGLNNVGIQVLRHEATGELVVCKKLPADDRNQNEWEAYIMQELTGHPNIVQFHGIQLSDSPNGEDKLFMEYCSVPCSEQEEVTNLYQLRQKYDEHRRGSKFPELFIWEIFESLLKALVFMHFGVCDPALPPPEGYVHIVHFDIHARNIFVSSSEDPANQTAYPRIVLGDFGNARRGVWFNSRKDRVGIGSLMSELTTGYDRSDILRHTEAWEFSEDLRSLVVEYRNIVGHPATDYDYEEASQPELVPFLQKLIVKKKELLERGTLQFEPLLLL